MGGALIPDVSGENRACLRDDLGFALLNYLLPKRRPCEAVTITSGLYFRCFGGIHGT